MYKISTKHLLSRMLTEYADLTNTHLSFVFGALRPPARWSCTLTLGTLCLNAFKSLQQLLRCHLLLGFLRQPLHPLHQRLDASRRLLYSSVHHRWSHRPSTVIAAQCTRHRWSQYRTLAIRRRPGFGQFWNLKNLRELYNFLLYYSYSQ